jgi:PII-like signaling protein
LIVDDATKIEAFLEDIRPLIGDSVVVLDDVVAFRA